MKVLLGYPRVAYCFGLRILHLSHHLTDGLLEGPTAGYLERRSSMSDSSIPPLRKEVQDYFKVCEELLSVALTPTAPRFSKEELEFLEFYADELAEKIFVLQVKNR